MIFFNTNAYGAVDQLLNDNFYQNPAELALTHQAKVILGNLFIRPSFRFTGVSSGKAGNASSTVNNSLPYLLTAYRFTDRFVFGINVTPSVYGHLDWPEDSIVAKDSTVTNALYYRIGAQSSYKIYDKLTLGLGLNIEDNKYFELNFVVPNFGNEVNKISGLNFSADIGLFYEINNQHSISAVIYSPVNTFGAGTSTLANTTMHNFSMNISEAAVASLGLIHLLSEKWFLEEKVYWSGWSLQKNLVFINSASGSYSVPTNWQDVWSFQVITRYAANDRFALLSSIIYETNPVPLATNALGYPLAASGAISAGLDITLQKELSVQILYSYGGFLPDSPIKNASSVGTVTAHFQAAVLQFIYKI